MGKQTPQAPLPPPVPPPPPPTPVQPVGGTGDMTPTEELARREAEQQAVVYSPDTLTTPNEPVMPASVMDTETAGRELERDQARKKGRRQTQVTGATGLLAPAKIKKRSLLSPPMHTE